MQINAQPVLRLNTIVVWPFSFLLKRNVAFTLLCFSSHLFPWSLLKGVAACFRTCRGGKQRLQYFPAFLIYILLLTHWSSFQSKTELYLSAKVKKKVSKAQNVPGSPRTSIEVTADTHSPHSCPLHSVDFLCLLSSHLSPAPCLWLSLSLIPNLTPKMQAVYLCVAEVTPLSSPTRCFIPKRDLFSKINGESRGLPKGYLPWQEVIASQNSPNKNHRALLEPFFGIPLHSHRL